MSIVKDTSLGVYRDEFGGGGGSGGGITDVTISGASIVVDGTADIPIGGATPGVFRLLDGFGVSTFNNALIAVNCNYALYSSSGNSLFVGKGTLENRLTAKVVITGGTIPCSAGVVYTRNIQSGDVFSLTTPTAGTTTTCELWLTHLSTAQTFSLPSGVYWADDSGNFASTNTPPTMTDASTTYCLVFRYDGTRWLGNLAYKVAL